jgi:AraC-like DNA-binding protein
VQYQDDALASAKAILHVTLGKSLPLISCYFLRNEKNAERIAEYTRFSMANQYLKSTYYRLTDIALLLGYSNLSSFSRAYFRYAR